MIGSPIIGFAVALAIMNVLLLVVHRWSPHR